MRSKRLSFHVDIAKRSKHWVSVHLHSSRAVMRCCLRKLGHNSEYTNAACWQPNGHIKDSCVAEIHLCRNHLSLATIVHESVHAALHRAHIIGVPSTDSDYQEFVCDDTGTITEGIIAYFDKNKVPVRYKGIPSRRLI